MTRGKALLLSAFVVNFWKARAAFLDAKLNVMIEEALDVVVGNENYLLTALEAYGRPA